MILGQLLSEAGYFSAGEVNLRIDSNWEPRPDVMAVLNREPARYPTKPVDIIIEILSPSQTLDDAHTKCWHYDRIGIPQILVFDPERYVAWQWDKESKGLQRIEELHLVNHKVVPVSSIWTELDRRLGMGKK